MVVKLAGVTVSLTPHPPGGGPCWLAGARHSNPVQLRSSRRTASVLLQGLAKACAREFKPDMRAIQPFCAVQR